MTHLALAGGTRQRGDRTFPAWPIRGAEERALVDEVVANGPWSFNGPKELEFNQKFAAFGGLPVEVFREALRAEGVPCGATYGPVWTTRLWGPAPHQTWRISSSAAAEAADGEAVILPQPVLLGSEDDMVDIAAAIRKIQAHQGELDGITVEKPQPASVARAGGR